MSGAPRTTAKANRAIGLIKMVPHEAGDRPKPCACETDALQACSPLPVPLIHPLSILAKTPLLRFAALQHYKWINVVLSCLIQSLLRRPCRILPRGYSSQWRAAYPGCFG